MASQSSAHIFAMLAFARPTPGCPFQELLRYRMRCQARKRQILANWRRLQSKKKVALILARTAALSMSFGPRTQKIWMHPRYVSKTFPKFIIYVVLSLIDQRIGGTMSYREHSLIMIGLKTLK